MAMCVIVLLCGRLASGASKGAEGGWVDLDREQLRRAEQLTSIFENGQVQLAFDFCASIGDGRGITFGYVGFTTATGDGYIVIQDYVSKKPTNNPFTPLLSTLRELAMDKSPSICIEEEFCDAVKKSANDKTFQEVQRLMAKEMYYDRSIHWGKKLGLGLALSKAQLYDAMVNHGEGVFDPFSIDHIVEEATKSAKGTPASGVDEAQWLKAFFEAREEVLLRYGGMNAARRVSFYRELLKEGNIHLDGPIYIDTITHPDGWTINNIYYGCFKIL